jgi:hypothetical protein
MTVHVLYLAMCTVGITQVLKEFIPMLTGKWALAAAMFTGALLSTVYILWPVVWNKLYIPILAISAAIVFYDTVFKLFKELITKLNTSGDVQTYVGDDNDG